MEKSLTCKDASLSLPIGRQAQDGFSSALLMVCKRKEETHG
jgi:hypothetical protein